MATRSSGIPPWAWALGAGGLAFILLRGRGGAATPALPPIPAPSPDATRRPTSRVTPLPEPPTTASSAGTLARLTASGPAGALARQVFYAQAVLYSFGISQNVPDGVLGPDTWAAINGARRGAGLPQSTTWTTQTITEVVSAVKAIPGRLIQPRLLPFALPSAVVDRINSEIVPLAGRGAPLLQAESY